MWMWELGHKEGWVPQNWCFWTVVLEKRERWLDGSINSLHVSLSKLWELVKDREALCAAVHRFMKSWTQFSDWTTRATKANNDFTCNMDFIHCFYFPLPSFLHTHAHTHSLGNHSLDSSFPLCNSNLFLSSGFLTKYLGILKSLSV